MTGLDIVVLLLVGWLAVTGFGKGFVTESISLLAWVVAFLAVRLFHTPVSAALAGAVGTESGASVFAAALLFGITFGAGRLIAGKFGKASKASQFAAFDRILGAGFGACKGLLAASLAFLIFSLGYDTIFGGSAARPDWITASRTFPLLDATARAIVDFAGERQRGGIADGSNAADPA